MHNGDFHLGPKTPGCILVEYPLQEYPDQFVILTKILHIITIHFPLVNVNENNRCDYILPGSTNIDYLKAAKINIEYCGQIIIS